MSWSDLNRGIRGLLIGLVLWILYAIYYFNFVKEIPTNYPGLIYLLVFFILLGYGLTYIFEIMGKSKLNNWPAWLKLGITFEVVFFALGILLKIIFPGQPGDNYSVAGIILLPFMLLFPLGFLSPFAEGAIIGWIYEKIKSRNQVQNQ